MQHKIILVGDINLMGVSDPAIPFAKIKDTLHAADVVFANLECCFYEPALERSVDEEGFYASLATVEALNIAGVHGIGNANNVNFGAPAIRSSLQALDDAGMPHCGAGINREAAAEPIIIERDGIRYGFMQRTSVFHSQGHAATDEYPGVATLKAHTAYRPPIENLRTITRPGMPPEVITWTEPDALEQFRADIATLKARADFVVSSNHWGLNRDVLQYQREIARAAIDAGADVVMGHGPHVPNAMEVYKGKPVFYGLGSFSFETGHWGKLHPDWIGLMAHLTVTDGHLDQAGFSFVRHNDRNETYQRRVQDETEEFEMLRVASADLGADLTVDGDRAIIRPKG